MQGASFRSKPAASIDLTSYSSDLICSDPRGVCLDPFFAKRGALFFIRKLCHLVRSNEREGILGLLKLFSFLYSFN